MAAGGNAPTYTITVRFADDTHTTRSGMRPVHVRVAMSDLLAELLDGEAVKLCVELEDPPQGEGVAWLERAPELAGAL